VSGGVLTMINPVITSKSPIMDQRSEGCLSIPQFYTYITRPRRVVVEYLTENFFRRVVLLEEVEAQAVQHEIDHLEGKLITDHVSRTQYRKAEALVKEHLNGRRS
jgi:peptide deformylase